MIEVVLFKQLKNLIEQDCCFVKYAKTEDAAQAIRSLHNQHVFPRQNFSTWGIFGKYGGTILGSRCGYFLLKTATKGNFGKNYWLLDFSKRNHSPNKTAAGASRGYPTMLGSFDNSYIPENPRTPPISYISQTVIPFKKPTSEPSKTFETKQKTVHICTKKKVCTYAKFLEKKKSFFRKPTRVTYTLHIDSDTWVSLLYREEQATNPNIAGLSCAKRIRDFFFPDPRSGNGFARQDEGDSDGGHRCAELIYSREPENSKPLTFSKNRLREAKNRSNTSPVAKNFFRKNEFFFKNFAYMQKKFLPMCTSFYNTYLKGFVKKNLKKKTQKNCIYAKNKKKVAYMQKLKEKSCFFGNFFCDRACI
ncbi:hypothetical protein LXL04_003111 [Taraxacum kok-saghyz]